MLLFFSLNVVSGWSSRRSVRSVLVIGFGGGAGPSCPCACVIPLAATAANASTPLAIRRPVAQFKLTGILLK
jgi:uncharacterized membrane protein YraQ (UPF0718 family)